MHCSAPAGSSLTQGVYEHLRADLLACRLLPGARLKINELCESLQVSLSAVREALARLTAEGLVVAEPQRGFRVAPISAAELHDLTQVRTQIEGACVGRAMAAGDVAWEAWVVAAHHRLARTPERQPGDPRRMNEDWSAAHDAFHEALASACDSPWLLRFRRILYDQSERYRRLSVPLAETARDIAGEHRAIMQATLSRDAARACLLLGQHFALTTSVLLQQAWPGGARIGPEPAGQGPASLP